MAAGRPCEALRQHATRARATSGDEVVDLLGVRLTHPDRVYYPELGFTKLDLALYYVSIADAVLPHLEGRPLTLVRCPDGLGGETFFQKKAAAWTPPQVLREALPFSRVAAAARRVRALLAERCCATCCARRTSRSASSSAPMAWCASPWKKAYTDGTVAVDLDPLSLACRLVHQRAPPYWKSQLLRRQVLEDEQDCGRHGDGAVAQGPRERSLRAGRNGREGTAPGQRRHSVPGRDRPRRAPRKAPCARPPGCGLTREPSSY